MTSWVNKFTSSTIYASEVDYTTLTVTADTQLYWPLDAPAGTPVASKIIDVTATAGAVLMPDATSASTGYTVLFNNVGSVTFTVEDNAGGTLLTVASGEAWQIYLQDNSTAAGGWKVYQAGAGTSTTNASALAGYGVKAISTTLNQNITPVAKSSNYTVLAADRAGLINWTGGVGTLTMTAAATLGSDWFFHLRNSGTGSVTVSAASINGSTSLIFNPGDSATIVCDGTAFYSVGFGQSATFVFDHTVISVAGSSNYTLSGTELNRISYEFTGALGASISVIVPNTVQQYWAQNSTTGGTLSIKTATQAVATVIPTGQRSIYYCNGSDIINAVTASVSSSVSGGSF